MSNFTGIRYFRADSTLDNWGDPTKISRDLLLNLDALRAALNTPIIVTSGFRKGDSSEHGKGTATDIVVPGFSGPLLDLYLLAERFDFKGIGVYPDWSYNGAIVGGLHVDVRQGAPGRWIGYRPSTGAPNNYFKLDTENILKIPGIV